MIEGPGRREPGNGVSESNPVGSVKGKKSSGDHFLEIHGNGKNYEGESCAKGSY